MNGARDLYLRIMAIGLGLMILAVLMEVAPL